MKKTI